MDNPLPLLEIRETPYKVSGAGKLNVRIVTVVLEASRIVAVNIDFEQRNLEVVATGGNDGVPLVQVRPSDPSAADDEDIDIELEEFAGWSIWAASASSDSVQVALIRL